MLEFVPCPAPPSPDDVCFAFDRYDAVGNLLVPPGTPWRRAELSRDFPDVPVGCYIGVWEGTPAYAIDLAGAETNPMQHARGNLYSMLGRIDDRLFAAQGRAMQFLRWQREHRFCGACGEAMTLGDGGRAMQCAGCAISRYPQLAPCAIVLVTRGSEMLLARGAGRGPGFYSTLAGFVEPGESAEEAVAREVAEEVGVRVKNVRYFGSQPWPFPSQLMLGYFAEYVEGEITPDPTEIADAQWFSPDNLPPVPPRLSIAGQLIHHFINEQAIGG